MAPCCPPAARATPPAVTRPLRAAVGEKGRPPTSSLARLGGTVLLSERRVPAVVRPSRGSERAALAAWASKSGSGGLVDERVVRRGAESATRRGADFRSPTWLSAGLQRALLVRISHIRVLTVRPEQQRGERERAPLPVRDDGTSATREAARHCSSAKLHSGDRERRGLQARRREEAAFTPA